MADTTYKRMDYDAMLYFVNYLLTKLKSSPLADNTTYTIVKNSGNTAYVLTDQDGTTISTISAADSSNAGLMSSADKSKLDGIVPANLVTQTDLAQAIAGITQISFQIVQTLPQTGAAGVIYLVANSGSGTNVYDEYIYVNNAFEKIGTTDVDLSGYVTKSSMVALTNAEITTIVDGAYSNVFGS